MSQTKSASSPHRRAERLLIKFPVSIRIPGTRNSEAELTVTRDISRLGISFTTRRCCKRGLNLLIAFEQGSGRSSGSREIPARVMRVSKLRNGNMFIVGARFTSSTRATAEFAELLRMQLRISQALLQILNAFSPMARLNQIIERISMAAAQAMEAEQVFILFPGNGHRNLRRATRHLGASLRKGLSRSIFGHAVSTGELLNIRVPSQHPLFNAELDLPLGNGTRSVLCIPLRQERDAVSGLLVALNKRHGPFTREDEVLGGAISNQIVAVLRQVSLMENISNIRKINERILASMASAVISFDKHRILTSVNPAASRIFGLHPRRDIGKNLLELLNGSTNARLCRLMERVLKTRKRQAIYDSRFLRPDQSQYSLNVIAVPMLAAKGTFAGAVVVAEDITKEQRLVSTLSRYLAREVAERVLHDKEQAKLGGTKTKVTILIADIRNFTKISEKMDAKDLMDLLNRYFSPMINVIFRNQGMVDKFMGDAILAVFGIPTPREDDPVRAVRAAIEMRKELSRMNAQIVRKEGISLEMGIGITSGIVLSGNLGSERRMDFTVIGDPVNLASRLESLTKVVKRNVLISESVYRAIKEALPCEYLGAFKIRGKSNKVLVYAVQTPG